MLAYESTRFHFYLKGIVIMKKLSILASAAALSVSAVSHAALISTTDQAAFNAGVVGLSSVIETFDSATPGIINQAGQAFPNFTVSWVNGTGSNMAVYITDNTFAGAQFAPFTSSQHLGWAEDSELFNGSGTNGPTVTITFDSAISGVSFDWYDTDSTDEYLLSVDGNNVSFPSATSFDGSTFFGVFDDSSVFTTLTFTSTSPGGFVEEMGLDNLTIYGQQRAAVPVPATFGLLGLGLASLVLVRRRV